MGHELVDELLALGSIAATIVSCLIVYFLGRRDRRTDALEETVEKHDTDIAHMQGWLNGKFSDYHIR